ncbi:MAG: hypothetical protein RR435_06490 [Erysipelotrichaceae bacterium]
MKIFKRIIKIILALIVLILLGYSLILNVYQDKAAHILPFQIYEMKDSGMEPLINKHDLVIIKKINNIKEVKRSDIVAVSYGNDSNSVAIRCFKNRDVIGSSEYYRTYALASGNVDDYHASVNKIYGVYENKIPYIGIVAKVVNSIYYPIIVAMAVLIYIGVRLINNSHINSNSVTRNKESKKKVRFDDLKLFHNDHYTSVQGLCCNYAKDTIYYLKIKIIYCSENNSVVDTSCIYVVGKEGLQPGEIKKFNSSVTYDPLICKYGIEVINFKEEYELHRKM